MPPPDAPTRTAESNLLREALAAVNRWLGQREHSCLASDVAGYATLRGLLDTSSLDLHLAAAFETLAALLLSPADYGPVSVCYACVRIAEWADGRDEPDTARAFIRAARAASPRMAESLVPDALWSAYGA